MSELGLSGRDSQWPWRQTKSQQKGASKPIASDSDFPTEFQSTFFHSRFSNLHLPCFKTFLHLLFLTLSNPTLRWKPWQQILTYILHPWGNLSWPPCEKHDTPPRAWSPSDSQLASFRSLIDFCFTIFWVTLCFCFLLPSSWLKTLGGPECIPNLCATIYPVPKRAPGI